MKLVNGTKIGVVLLGFALISLGCLSRSEAASFQGLGDLPDGDFFSGAYEVSADGSVVVGWGTSASGVEAFRWTAGGGMVGLGDLPGGTVESFAVGVSADGSVVVGESNSISGYSEAFRWTAGSGMEGLGDLPADGFDSRANGVSSDGSVVVGWGLSASGCEAFRWTDLNDNGVIDPDEKLENHPEFGLGDLPGGIFYSIAYDVSADGSVVAGWGYSAQGREAFRWTSSDGMVGLGDLASGVFDSYALSVSADGSVIVGLGNSALGVEAFRWTDGGGMVGLGFLPGGDLSSKAYGVSSDGSVVVGFGFSGTGQEAFIWDTAKGMRNLRDVLVNDYGLDLTDWTLTSARGVSADGFTIVGYGTNPDGYDEAWIATIPEPGTLVLVAIGALGLLFGRRKKR